MEAAANAALEHAKLRVAKHESMVSNPVRSVGLYQFAISAVLVMVASCTIGSSTTINNIGAETGFYCADFRRDATEVAFLTKCWRTEGICEQFVDSQTSHAVDSCRWQRFAFCFTMLRVTEHQALESCFGLSYHCKTEKELIDRRLSGRRDIITLTCERKASFER